MLLGEQARERRHCHRRCVESLIYVELEPDSGAILLNLSEGGAAVSVARPFLDVQRVGLKFQIPGIGYTVDAAGQIIWLDAHRQEAGIEFVDLSERSRRLIHRWMISGKTLPQPEKPRLAETRREPPPLTQKSSAVKAVGSRANEARCSRGSDVAAKFLPTLPKRHNPWVGLCFVLILGFVLLFGYVHSKPELTTQAGAPAEIPGQPAPASAGSAAALSPAPDAPDVDEDAVLLDSADIPCDAIVLQVAALSNKDDAAKLAQALRDMGFPTLVLTSSLDRYFRVQVGPHADVESARVTRNQLARAGYPAILRRHLELRPGPAQAGNCLARKTASGLDKAAVNKERARQ